MSTKNFDNSKSVSLSTLKVHDHIVLKLEVSLKKLKYDETSKLPARLEVYWALVPSEKYTITVDASKEIKTDVDIEYNDFLWREYERFSNTRDEQKHPFPTREQASQASLSHGDIKVRLVFTNLDEDDPNRTLTGSFGFFNVIQEKHGIHKVQTSNENYMMILSCKATFYQNKKNLETGSNMSNSNFKSLDIQSSFDNPFYDADETKTKETEDEKKDKAQNKDSYQDEGDRTSVQDCLSFNKSRAGFKEFYLDNTTILITHIYDNAQAHVLDEFAKSFNENKKL